MANQNPLRSWSESDYYELFTQAEDLFALLDESLSLNYNSSINNPFKDLQTFSSLDLDESISTLSQDVSSESRNEITSTSNDQVQPNRDGISRDSNMENVLHEGTEKLTKETIKQYFNMPITQAAKELDIGLTQMKKRCRELGFSRWPYRKLMSIQALNYELEDSEKIEEDVNKRKRIRDAIEFLKMEKKMIEENPDLEFGVKTKRLRQAHFKANCKRSKLFSSSTSSTSSD